MTDGRYETIISLAVSFIYLRVFHQRSQQLRFHIQAKRRMVEQLLINELERKKEAAVE
jgi:hypothetical protein